MHFNCSNKFKQSINQQNEPPIPFMGNSSVITIYNLIDGIRSQYWSYAWQDTTGNRLSLFLAFPSPLFLFQKNAAVSYCKWPTDPVQKQRRMHDWHCSSPTHTHTSIPTHHHTHKMQKYTQSQMHRCRQRGRGRKIISRLLSGTGKQWKTELDELQGVSFPACLHVTPARPQSSQLVTPAQWSATVQSPRYVTSRQSRSTVHLHFVTKTLANVLLLLHYIMITTKWKADSGLCEYVVHTGVLSVFSAWSERVKCCVWEKQTDRKDRKRGRQRQSLVCASARRTPWFEAEGSCKLLGRAHSCVGE